MNGSKGRLYPSNQIVDVAAHPLEWTDVNAVHCERTVRETHPFSVALLENFPTTMAKNVTRE